MGFEGWIGLDRDVQAHPTGVLIEGGMSGVESRGCHEAKG